MTTEWWQKADAEMARGGITRQRIAEVCGEQPHCVYDWLSGRTKPSLPFILCLSRALGVDLDWLLDETQEGPWDPEAQAAEALRAVSPDAAAVLEASADRRIARVLAATARALLRELPERESGPRAGRPTVARRARGKDKRDDRARPQPASRDHTDRQRRRKPVRLESV